MEGCLNAGATIDEIMETLKIVVIGGDLITFLTRGLPCMLRVKPQNSRVKA
ncbi:hypothetical protein ACWGJQ_18250 [Peribacillus simplex]